MAAGRGLRYRWRQLAKTVVLAVGKRVPSVARAARRVRDDREARRYSRHTRGIVADAENVVFESYLGRSYSCSPRAVYERMLVDSRYSGWGLTWSLQADFARALAELGGYRVEGLEDEPGQGDARDLKGVEPEALEALKRAKIVVHGSKAYDQSYASSRFWVTNSMLPAHLWPTAQQAYVQFWHGTPLKRLGCDVTYGGYALMPLKVLHSRYRREGERLTYLVTPSEYVSERLTSAFGLDEDKRGSAIVEVGYPRNDRLAAHSEDEVRRARHRLGIPDGKTAVLYAPTWRDDQHDARKGYTYRNEVDFARLRADLGGEYVVLFRTHYFVASRFDFDSLGGFVIDVSSVDDVNEVCLAGDILVTDYSSVFFDYANLERPMVFHMYDRDRYESEQRGFYLSLDELPGQISSSHEELVAAILSAGRPSQDVQRRYAAFRRRFNRLDDGRASERALARIMPPL